MIENKVLRFGLIGLGGMANHHFWLLSQLENVKITALCDVNSQAVQSHCKKYQIPMEKGYTDFETLIKDPEVDVVISIVPNKFHATVLKKCIQYGKAVMTEKPFTLTFEEADELEKLYRVNPIPCMVGFSYRYIPSFRYAKKLLEEGKLGTIRHVSVQYLQEWGSPLFQVPFNWRFCKVMSGSGALGDLGSHMIDSARLLIGEFQSVGSVMQTFIPERNNSIGEGTQVVDVDDFTSFQTIFENGVIGNFVTSRNAIGYGNHLELTIHGDLGTINICCEQPEEITLCIKNVDYKENKFITEAVSEEYRRNQLQDFIDLVLGKNPEYIPSFYDGYQNQKIMDCIIRSAGSGQMVMI